MNLESQVTVSNVGTRSMTLFNDFVSKFCGRVKLQLEKKVAVKIRMMFSN